MRRNHHELSKSVAPILSRIPAFQDDGCTGRSCLWPLEHRLPCEASNASKSLPEARGINSHLTTKNRQLHHLMHVAQEDVGILTRGVSHQRLLEFNLRPAMVGASGSSSLWISNSDKKVQICKWIMMIMARFQWNLSSIFFLNYIIVHVHVLPVRLLWPHTRSVQVHFQKVHDHITFSDLRNRLQFDSRKHVILSIVNAPKKKQLDANEKSSLVYFFYKFC